MAEVCFSFLLHSHMPYVRRNGDWPCGEEWILEAWAESYLPIWRLVEELTSGTVPGKLALTVTPVLAEQLEDDYLQERLVGYLENRIRQAHEETRRLSDMGDTPRVRLTSFYIDRYGKLLHDFQDRLQGKMLNILRAGIKSGRVEVLASAATHPLLPSLGSDVCRRAQVAVGLESYRRSFGSEPRGFWIPECAYTPDLDAVLSKFSPPLEYVILDYSAPDSAPEEAHTWEPRRLGSTPLLALMRDQLAHDLVWTWDGIPSHSHYREYSKRDWQGHGYQYWRVTSLDTPLDDKDLYNPEAALTQVSDDARGFADALQQRKSEILPMTVDQTTPGMILAAYDTELFGHWWLEGADWLREVLELVGDDIKLPGQVAGKVLAGEPPALSPRITAWNANGEFTTWVNPNTEDIWEMVRGSEENFLWLMQSSPLKNRETERAALQAARELLLMEASDWTYMITREQAAAYARDRFLSHLERFNFLMDMLHGTNIDPERLSSMEEIDNVFPWINLTYWQ